MLFPPKYMFTDTHTHLTSKDYEKDLEAVIENAQKEGVTSIINIGSGYGLEDNFRSLELAKKYPHIYSTIGFHPHDAAIMLENKDPLEALEKLAEDEKVVAVGEIGLDYHYIAKEPDLERKKAQQVECFVKQLLLARKLKLPVIIHDRDAHNDTIFTIKRENGEENGGVMHCFSGDVELAKKTLDLGFYVSITGAVTFKKKSEVLQDVVRAVPIERLLIETDCPFIAPEPFRGKRNEPAYVPLVAKKIAELKGLSVEDVARITTLNAQKLFRLKGALPEPRIAYTIRDSLYLNITNRCTLACVFCPKRTNDFEVKGYNLRLAKEPDVEDVFEAIGDPAGYKEVVFCGYGEPTVRLELLKVIAGRLKQSGVKHIRLNTDGLASLVHGRNVLPELKGLIDMISVSLNAHDRDLYAKLCVSKYGAKAFDAACDFIIEAKKYIPNVTVTAVTCPEVDVKEVERIAKEELGVEFRRREYQEVG